MELKTKEDVRARGSRGGVDGECPNTARGAWHEPTCSMRGQEVQDSRARAQGFKKLRSSGVAAYIPKGAGYWGCPPQLTRGAHTAMHDTQGPHRNTRRRQIPERYRVERRELEEKLDGEGRELMAVRVCRLAGEREVLLQRARHHQR